MSKKIPVSAPQSPLQSPFAALDVPTLPDPAPCSSSPAPAKKTRSHRIVLRREKSQRGGKTVVVASQFPTHLSPAELENLLKKAKQSLGCGGSLAGREMELQGDQPARVCSFFEGCGFQVGGTTS